jgi:hypothetical protein
MLNRKHFTFYTPVAALGLVGLLAGCGGGGGDDGDTFTFDDFDSTVSAAKMVVVSEDNFIDDPSNTISWEAVAGAESYTLFYEIGDTDVSEASPFLTTSSTSIVHDNLLAGQTYQYRVAAVANGETSALSDPIAGTPQLAKTPEQLNDVAYNGSTLVAVGDSGVILTSSDGTNDDWGLLEDPALPDNSLAAVTWVGDNAEFLAVGASGTVLRSSDGANWTSEVSEAFAVNTDLEDVAWIGDRYLVVGKNSTIITGTVGGVWEQVSSAAINPDGTASDNTNVTFQGVASNGASLGDTIVLVGTNGTMFVGKFADLGAETPWIDLTDNIVPGLTINQSLNDVTWDGSRFIVVGSNDTVLTGEFDINDELVWTNHIPGTPDISLNGESQYDALWDSNLALEPQLVAVGSAGNVVFDPDAGEIGDGVDATILNSADTGTTQSLTAVTWFGTALNGYFVVVGNDGTVMTINQQ